MFKLGLAVSVLAWVVAGTGQAQSAQSNTGFPTKPVRMVVPTAPGGGVDTAARIVAQKLTEAWGQQVVVDNRAGASGLIGSEIVAHAPADGHTLLIAPTTFSTSKSLFGKLPYDPVKDFSPVTLVSREPNILVTHPSLPVKSVQDLVSLAKTKPNTLNYGFGGTGSTASLSGALFKLRTGVDMVGVSYKGNGPAVNALVAGEVQVMFVGLPPTLPLLKSGKLRALAVTSRERSPFLPDAPTMEEAGVSDYEVTNWIGILAPSATPQAILRKINSDTVRALAEPAVRERFAFYGVVPAGTTADEFRRFLNAEFMRWDKVIKAAKLRLEAN